jgi:adenosylhomocysteine nucleosidase
MSIVVFEDDDNKWTAIRGCLLEKGVSIHNIKRIGNVSQFVEISGKAVDLCIIDIRMPSVIGGSTRSAGAELLQMLDYSGMRRVPVLAITAYPEEAKQLQNLFSSRGCIIFDYYEKQVWSQALDIYIAQSKDKGRYEFLFFTALKKERDAYLSLQNISARSVQRNGLDLLEFDLDDKSGAVVLLPRMGIINAAVTTARALELYSPSIVAMSGICAGMGANAELGQLLVTDIVWEYQSGKWLDEMFESEPYQVSIPQNTRLALSQLLDRDNLMSQLEGSFSGKVRPSKISTPKLAPFTTGSAVIASDRRLDAVKLQHRKVAGLDMELYGFHRAVELSSQLVHAYSAKVVVDKANEAKSDELHEYGCVISAAFVLEAASTFLSQR